MTDYSRRRLLATGAAEVALNPSEVTPPPTDHGNLGTLKYAFSEAHNRHTAAGRAREVTLRNFLMSKDMAGVDTLRFLEVFATGQYADISLAAWMANTRLELVAAHLKMDVATLKRISQQKTPVLPA